MEIAGNTGSHRQLGNGGSLPGHQSAVGRRMLVVVLTVVLCCVGHIIIYRLQVQHIMLPPTATPKIEGGGAELYNDSTVVDDAIAPAFFFPWPDGRNVTVRVYEKGESICSSRILPGTHTVITGVCGSDSTGNVLSRLYLASLIAAQANATVELKCDHSDKNKNGLEKLDGMAWNFTYLGSTKTISPMPQSFCATCKSFPHTCPVGICHALPLIRESMRLYEPPEPDVMDDVTIHLRCGDILKYAHHTEYGFPRYSTYLAKLSQHSPRSIGIATLSFDPNIMRKKDLPFLETCRRLVVDLADFLEEAFLVPVTIRNNDTVPQSMGRMVHSRVTWCNPSTFCLYPSLGSHGQGYFVKSPKLYPFIEELQEENIKVLDVEFLNMQQIVHQHMNAEDIIQWLRKK